MIAAWFSGGCTSAVACKMILDTIKDEEVRLVYIETGSHHPDILRFKSDCEAWYGRPIEVIQNKRYKDVLEVLRKERFINSPSGAKCTGELKRKMRLAWEKEHKPSAHVWGFHFEPRELKRRDRLASTYTGFEHLFPLIDAKLDKSAALRMLMDVGIELPAMYKMGYSNNNCIGCVKGGMGYWNKIRADFPEVFEKTAKMEREIGRSCLRKHFLDELPVDAGKNEPLVLPECGSVGEGCEIERGRWFATRE